MKIKQSTQSSLLKKVGSLLLAGSMLATGILSSCSKSDGNQDGTGTTTAQNVVDTPAPEIEHFVQSDDGIYSLVSPDGGLQLNIFTQGVFGYSVTATGADGSYTEWVSYSDMGIEVDRYPFYRDGTTVVTDAVAQHINRTFPLMGNQSTVTDNCYEAVFTLESNGYTYYLDARIYDDGVAFRYRLPALSETGTRRVSAEYTTYNLRKDIYQSWYGVNNQDFEPSIEFHDPHSADEVNGDQICMPLTAVVENRKGYISIMEGALTETSSGVNLKAAGDCSYSSQYFTRPDAVAGDIVTGWHLINVADDLNGLVNNYNVYSVNEPMDEELFADTSWIEPGRSAWSWNVDYSAPGYQQMLDYTRMAAELGYEYNIIDEGWRHWEDYEAKLTDIGLLGEQYGVKQILWGNVTFDASRPDSNPNAERVDQFFDLMERAHLYGAKIDFWWSEARAQTTDLQLYVLTEAAKRHYVINLHGCNKNTGLNVTFPNEVTREAIRGQENVGNSNNSNYELQATWLNKQLYTRFLCGHADWTPATHTAMQIASVILIDSPFMTISTDPSLLLQSPALEFIKSIPTTWDKTVVLPESIIDQYSVYAKQKDGVWFVGGIASATQTNAKVKLSDFITDDGTYTAEIWTGGKNNLTSKTMQVTKNDVIEIGRLNSSEGFAMRLTKLDIDRHGGLTDAPINVTAPAGATVKYTTDGSDPRTSDTAVTVSGGTITLTETCRLKVAITDGEGKGTMLSYKFAKIN